MTNIETSDQTVRVNLPTSGHAYLGHSYEHSEAVLDNTLFWDLKPHSETDSL